MKYLLLKVILQWLIPLQVVSFENCDNDKASNHLHICSTDPNYDKGIPSFEVDKKPLALKTSATIYSVDEIDENQEAISLHILLTVFWNDSRLLLKPENSSRYELKEADIEQIFYPTLRIGNHRHVEKSFNVGPTNSDYFWFGGVSNNDAGPHYLEYQYLFGPHYLEYRQSLRVTVYCPFDFSRFPFDTNECNLTFGSTDVFKTMLVMSPPWIRYEYGLHKNGNDPLKLEQSRLPFDIQLESMQPFVHTEAGFEYSYAGIKILVSRNTLRSLGSGFFVPTSLFSILALMSYMIHPDVVPGRLGLLITLWLIVANVYNSVKAPNRRGFGYIDIWMIGVQGPILFALLEYALLLSLKRFWKMPAEWTIASTRAHADYERTGWNIEIIGWKLDLISCIVSFCFIIMFNLGYWINAYF